MNDPLWEDFQAKVNEQNPSFIRQIHTEGLLCAGRQCRARDSAVNPAENPSSGLEGTDPGVRLGPTLALP